MNINLKNIDFQLEIISHFNPADRLNELDEIPKTPDGYTDYWQAANLLCAKDGGRLPTVEELQLIAVLQKNKLIDTNYSGYFWSSTLYSSDTDWAWGVYFNNCTQDRTTRDYPWQVLCVR